jgi:predicted nucleotidyltransferase
MRNQRRPLGSSPTPKPAEALKADLAARIIASVDRMGLTVREAEARTSQAAADFSRLRGGQLDRFTIERLLDIAGALGERLSLSLTAEGQSGAASLPGPLADHARALRILCRRFSVRRLGAFGSVLRDDFDPARSDIDLAVEFGRSRRYGPADQYFRFKESLERLLGREVDLVELRAMPDSRLKQSIERTQVPVYEQAA